MKRPTTWIPAERDGAAMMADTLADWRAQGPRADLWLFAYASLVWRPEFEAAEARPARVHGHHRCLQMWSRVNRGTLERLWAREMPNPVYDPKWLRARTPQGEVRALAFTLSRKSPSHTGVLPPERYREIFARSCGRYGTTLDYARQTFEGLKAHGIHDHALERLLRLAD